MGPVEIGAQQVSPGHLHLDGSRPTLCRQKRDTQRVSLFYGVDNGTRTHDLQSHNLTPYPTRPYPPYSILLNACVKVARQKGLVKSRSGSVEPSPATLIRVAFDRSSPAKPELKMARQKGLEPLTYCLEG